MNTLALYSSTVLIWGSTWLAIKYQLGHVAPEVSIAYRFALAAILLIAYATLSGIGMRFKIRDHAGMAMQGLFLFSANYFVFYLATEDITTGLIAVVFSSIVVTNIIFGALFFRTPVNARVVMGATLGMTGLAIIFWPEINTFDLSAGGTRGLALCLAGTVLASLGNMASVANQKRNLPVLQTNAYGMTYGAIIMFMLALLRGQEFNFDSSPEYIGSLVYLALFGSVLAFGCYLTLLGRIGAGKAAYATVLFPVIALALSTVFEDYQFSREAFIGMLLVLSGNALVLAKSDKAKTGEAPA